MLIACQNSKRADVLYASADVSKFWQAQRYVYTDIEEVCIKCIAFTTTKKTSTYPPGPPPPPPSCARCPIACDASRMSSRYTPVAACCLGGRHVQESRFADHQCRPAADERQSSRSGRVSSTRRAGANRTQICSMASEGEGRIEITFKLSRFTYPMPAFPQANEVVFIAVCSSQTSRFALEGLPALTQAK
jgi:hypothetical protein